MINGYDMTNVKSALRRLYFIEGMLAGNDEEAASARMSQHRSITPVLF